MGLLNVGSTDRIAIRELAEVVRDAIDPSLELTFADRHPADAEHTHADSLKAGPLIDYEPTASIREGVERFIEWCRENRERYEPLVLAS